MALDRQSISISFQKGVDTKSDPKQVLIGRLLTLENCTFKKVGSFQKRNGYKKLGSTFSISNSISSYNSELVVTDGSNLYSYNQGSDSFLNKGKKIAVDLSIESVIKNSAEQTSPDSAFSSSKSCYAWNDSSGGVHYSVFDNLTNATIISNSLISSTSSNPKVISFQGYFIILYVDSGLKALTINQNTLATSTLSIASFGSNNYFDASVISTRLFITYTDSGNYTSIIYLDSSLTLSSAYQVTEASKVKTIFGDSSNNVYVAYDSGTSLKFFSSPYALGSNLIAPTVIETISNIQNVAAIWNSSTVYFYYEILNSTGSTSDNFIRKNTYSGSVGTPSDYLRSVGLYSKPFIYNSSVTLTVAHESKLQSCYFVTDSSGSVICKIAPNNGGGLSTIGLLAEINQTSSNQFAFAYLYKDLVQSVNGDVYTQTGVNEAYLTFQNKIYSQSIGNNLNLGAGCPSVYDGQNVVEKNFNLYPEDLSVLNTKIGGGLGTGSYQYCATYEWTDQQGQVHESTPSIPVTTDTNLSKSYLQGHASGSSLIADSGFDWNYVCPGTLVQGSGIPANTYVAYGANVASGIQPALSTSTSSTTLTMTPGKAFNYLANLGSNKITLPEVNYGYGYVAYGSMVAGSNILTLSVDCDIHVGAAIGYYDGTNQQTAYVTNKNGLILTLDSNSVITITNGAFNFQLIFYYTSSVGSYTITQTSPTTVFFDSSIVGKTMTISSLPSVVATVVSVSGANITFDKPWTYSGTHIGVFGIKQNAPNVGEVYTDLGSCFSGQVTIKEVNGNVLTLDQQAYASNGAAVLSNMVSSGAQTAKITVPTLRVTDKSKVNISVYRTLVNQNTFYRVSSFVNPTLNDKSIDSVSIIDTIPDSLLIGNEQLYTTGSVLENYPPPAASVVSAFKTRLLVIPSENKKSIWYSKQVSPGVVPEFNPSFVLNYPELGGDLTAIGQMDEKLIAFKRNNIYYIVGDGPAATGLSNDFSEPVSIPSDVGCISQSSVVLMPSGLMFQSTKGIYLLDRSLQVSYIGHDVEAYNSYSVTSAKLVEGVNEVRFTLNNGQTLVFDYLIQQWSVFTNPGAVDSTIFGGLYTYFGTSGKVLQENPGVYTDDGALIPIKLVTSWLSMAGLQSFQRAYKLLVLGEYKSAHQMNLSVAYDFQNSYTQNITIPVTSAPSGQYQFKLLFEQQKCEAIQITLSETQNGISPYGEGLSLSSFGLEVGAKKGLNKVSSAKSYG